MELQELARLLNINLEEANKELIENLEWLLKTTRRRLEIRLGGIEVPLELEYIITEVSVVRFNRMGSEGYSNHTLEGETINMSKNDFEAYELDIKHWLRNNVTKGKVRFL